ncbi:MAG: 23S rRNA (guanosine(2251)-2'-O)-methyltransferase RlmB [Bacteroidetes bacterium]|nr:23S rRNA (guanosine(2251)-2'-O)-methyltransferase RlmB [Bacteroidota bacterium]
MGNKSTNIVGRQPVLEALMEGIRLERIYLQKNAIGEAIDRIRQLARDQAIPVNLVPHEKLSAMTRIQHQGVVAINSIIEYVELQDAIDWVNQQGQVPLFVMLDGITDVRNIGAIARSAKCCGSQMIILPDKGVGALNEEAMKSSAGALQKIMITRVNSLLKAIDTLRMNGIEIVVTEMQGKDPIYATDLTQPICLVMGSEDKGVQPYIAKAATMRCSIPMPGGFESFNVSVASGIFLYEATRQRMQH